MRAIDAALLHELALGGVPAIVSGLARELARQLPEAGLDTPLRAAHFLAQGVFETWYLTRLEEDLNYSALRLVREWPKLARRGAELANNPHALANAAYAGVDGNGDEASGDGWLFRGRGFLELTGRNNYALAAALDDPDSVATPQGAIASAILFWKARAIDGAADHDDIAAVTSLVSGSEATAFDRALVKHRAYTLLTRPRA